MYSAEPVFYELLVNASRSCSVRGDVSVDLPPPGRIQCLDSVLRELSARRHRRVTGWISAVKSLGEESPQTAVCSDKPRGAVCVFFFKSRCEHFGDVAFRSFHVESLYVSPLFFYPTNREAVRGL